MYSELKLFLANNVDPDGVAHDKPPHLDLHCLPKIISICNMA